MMLEKKLLTALVLLCTLYCSSSAFAESNHQNWESLVGVTIGAVDNDRIYQRFAKGQCTWYAWGRFYEVNHKKIKFKERLGLDAKLWPELIANCRVDDKLKEKSIAVSSRGSYGHLIFIEHIQGNTIYYTEANGDANCIFNRGTDCILQKVKADDEFIKSFTMFIHL